MAKELDPRKTGTVNRPLAQEMPNPVTSKHPDDEAQPVAPAAAKDSKASTKK